MLGGSLSLCINLNIALHFYDIDAKLFINIDTHRQSNSKKAFWIKNILQKIALLKHIYWKHDKNNYFLLLQNRLWFNSLYTYLYLLKDWQWSPSPLKIVTKYLISSVELELNVKKQNKTKTYCIRRKETRIKEFAWKFIKTKIKTTWLVWMSRHTF